MATLAQLGARALRKLGVSVVAFSDQPAIGAATTSDSVVTDVLRNLGILVADADRPAPLPTVSLTDLGGRTARAVGLNPLDLLGGTTGIRFNQAQIATKVLQKLAVIASDETPLAQDQLLAIDKVYAVHDSLVAMGFVTWTVDVVPTAVVEFYVSMAANLAAPEFGKPGSLEALNAARESVREIALSGARGQALAEQKVQAVHDGLNALGLVPWPVTAVPAAHAEDYVTMASTLLAPVMGKPVDKEAWALAEGRVRQAGMVRGATARATQKVQTVHAEMQGMGLVSWTVDTIPASMRDAYASAATALMGDETGKFNAVAYASQMARVRMLAMGGAAGQALAQAKVQAVHYLLDARGKTRWTLYDIPDYVEEAYVFMAATWLAPEVGVKADPAWWPMAEMNLDRVISIPTSHRPVIAEYI